jgi:hypothetical protein
MDTSPNDRHNSFPRRTQMSTVALHSGFTGTPAARRRPERAPALRLTRRGRVVAVLLFLGLLLAAVTALGPRSAATGEPGTPVQTRTVEVGPGDSLWEIAADVAPPGQVRETVHEIQELNALTGSGVAVGQTIAVPVG